MNLERMVDEYLEHAEHDRTDGVGRMLARRALRRPSPRPWSLFWLLAGVLVGWLVSR